MKIAVTSTGTSLDSEIDPRFGRCRFFLLVETDDLEFEALENQNISLGGGAGIQSARFMDEKQVKYVLTGNCGPNAYRTLEAAGIQVITGCYGTVRQAVESFRSGSFESIQGPNVESHFGTGFGPGSSTTAGSTGLGRGMGMGRARGIGGGKGMGRGTRMGRGRSQDGPAAGAGPSEAPYPPAADEELDTLKQQAQALEKQLKQIERKMQEIQQKKKNDRD
jgi:predicted Fe-Mo cluster-binding NifX family protein